MKKLDSRTLLMWPRFSILVEPMAKSDDEKTLVRQIRFYTNIRVHHKGKYYVYGIEDMCELSVKNPLATAVGSSTLSFLSEMQKTTNHYVVNMQYDESNLDAHQE